MRLLKRIFSRYTGVLRSFKLTYVLNNILNYRQLSHNRKMIDKYDLKRSVLSPVGTTALPETKELPWLDTDNAMDDLENSRQYKSFSEDIQSQLRRFVSDGFMILEKFYDHESILRHNEEIDHLRESRKIDFNYSGSKIMDVYRECSYIDKRFFRNQKLMEIFEFIFQKKIIPFQTIHFIKGSQQKAHSDSIHMSTYPPGYLLAAWTALEDIGMEQGPVYYYPGSHRLPYVSCEDYNSGNTVWRIGKDSYRNYEQYVERLIENEGLEPVYFTPGAGDVLIWHANLLHGGLEIRGRNLTRRSMVGHYFADDVFCYHEISQRPALISDSE